MDLKMDVVVCICILMYVSCLWMTCVTCSLRFKYSMHSWTMCDNEANKLLKIRRISVEICIYECRVRSQCKSVNFEVIRRKCNLQRTDENMASTYNKRPCVFIRMSDVRDIYPLPEICQNCTANEVCNVTSKRCEVQECDLPSVPDATSLGNIRGIGSRVKIVNQMNSDANSDSDKSAGTHIGSEILQCNINGDWTSVSQNIIVDCGLPPSVTHATVSPGKSVQGSTRTYTCNDGYTPVNHDSTEMITTCTDSGNWAAVGLQCDKTCEELRGSCYFVKPTQVNFTEAQDYCRSNGAHLVQVRNQTEQTRMLKYIVSTYGNEPICWWIGVQFIEDEWKHTQTGSTIAFTRWGQGEPNYMHLRDRNCVQICSPSEYWNNLPCYRNMKTICDKMIS